MSAVSLAARVTLPSAPCVAVTVGGVTSPGVAVCPGAAPDAAGKGALSAVPGAVVGVPETARTSYRYVVAGSRPVRVVVVAPAPVCLPTMPYSPVALAVDA